MNTDTYVDNETGKTLLGYVLVVGTTYAPLALAFGFAWLNCHRHSFNLKQVSMFTYIFLVLSRVVINALASTHQCQWQWAGK